MKILFSGATNIGKKRERNEDFFKIVPDKNLIVLCDGMGGLNAGDVASKIAATTVCELFHSRFEKKILQTYSDITRELPKEAKEIAGLIRLANKRIFNLSISAKSTNSQMGTTIEVVHFSKNYVFIGHVGDSRIYRLRNNELKQITHDHSWINELIEDKEITESEAESYRIRNIITRALGVKPSVKIDVIVDNARKDDLYLICSDGLTGPVKDDLIADILYDEEYVSLNDKANKLIEMANRNGGPDNITVALAKVQSFQPEKLIVPKIKAVIPEVAHNIQENENRLLEEIYGKIKKKSNFPSIKHFIIFGLIIILLGSLIIALNPFRFYRNKISPTNDFNAEKQETISTSKGALLFSLSRDAYGLAYDNSEIFIDGIMKGKVKNYVETPLQIETGEHFIELIFVSDTTDTIYTKKLVISTSSTDTIKIDVKK